MLKCRLTMTGLEETIAGVDEAFRLYFQYITEVLDAFGRAVTEDAKQDHPYMDHTFVLTNSIGYTVEGWSARTVQVNIFATAPYAEEVEYGTSHSRAYPFLFPKFYTHLEGLQDSLQGAVNKALTDGAKFGGINDRRSSE